VVKFLRRVAPGDWMPVGVDGLEPDADAVVRSAHSCSVIAGPGAGKTELLAQRAAFLLQTGASVAPRRILAISYKREAARNLAARVQRRCHGSHSGRLDSLTFDAFAKGLVDRFGQALPDRWRPRPDYEIMQTGEVLYSRFLAETVGSPPPSVGTYADVQAIGVKHFERIHLLGSRLPVEGWTAPTPGQWAADRFWQSSLHKGPKTQLSFPMIGRLAELLLRLVPMARTALQLTYSHLFMDEFQDTTQVQYDLMHTVFRGTDVIITAVGDNKQQIMRWAMAMRDPFAALESDFGAARNSLRNNYRSSPELVRIQHVLAQALDTSVAAPVAKAAATVTTNSCAILDFESRDAEAAKLAGLVRTEMKKRSLTAKDFVLIVRQTPYKYAPRLENAFRAAGIALRNEAAAVGEVVLQELMADEASDLVVAVLRLAATSRAGRIWADCLEALGALRGVAADDEAGQARLMRELDAFVLGLTRSRPAPPKDQAEAEAVVAELLSFVGRERLIAAHPAYAQGKWFAQIENAAAVHLAASSQGAADWTAALDAYEGVHTVPLMTIHRSKGLEYHTVIFVGLDDGAWARSLREDEAEAIAGFFVAFTRAKQRVLFTYCAQRAARDAVDGLYQLLLGCGVKIIPVK